MNQVQLHSHDQCLNCGGTAKRYMQHDEVGCFFKCRCGLIFQDPREFVSESEGLDSQTSSNSAETFRKAFSESIDTSDKSGNMYADHGIDHQRMVEGILDDLVDSIHSETEFDFDSPFSLLDIGCATGFLLDAIKRRFPHANVSGVEPSPVSAAKARKLYGLEVHVGTMNTFPISTEVYDIVTVLGNLQLHENPFQTLEQARETMKPGGILVCQFKNPNCSARVLGRVATRVPFIKSSGTTKLILERGFTCMRHSGNKKSLRAAIENTGLEVVHVETIAPRMAKFSDMKQGHAQGVKGKIWSALNWLDKQVDQQAWIQLVCRNPKNDSVI